MEKNRNPEQVAEIISNGSLSFTDDYTEIRGNVRVKEMSFSGDAEIYGDVTAETIKVAGDLKVTGNLVAKVLEAEGEVTVDESAKVDDISAETILVKKNLESSVEIETGILIVEEDLKAYVVSLGNNENERLEDVFLVDGKVTVEEAIYVNEVAEFVSEEEIPLSE